MIQLSNKMKKIHRNLRERKSPPPFPPSGHKIPLRPLFLCPYALVPFSPSCLSAFVANSYHYPTSSIQHRESSSEYQESRIEYRAQNFT